jgi:hypothetical protein
VKITRRSFVRNSLLGLGVASVGAAFWNGFGFWDDYHIRHFVLEQFKELTDEEVESFALEYQALYPEGTQPEALLRGLRGGVAWSPVSAGAWRERYRQRIRDDFQSNDTVDLKNWILSRTEASMLCLNWRLRRAS